MRVTTTTLGGPVATMPSVQVDVEFSHLIWTNFSGPDRAKGRHGNYTRKAKVTKSLLRFGGRAFGWPATIAFTALDYAWYGKKGKVR